MGFAPVIEGWFKKHWTGLSCIQYKGFVRKPGARNYVGRPYVQDSCETFWEEVSHKDVKNLLRGKKF